MLYNPDFNCTEFGTIKNVAGSNNFVLSVKTWIERTSAIGIRSKAARLAAKRELSKINYRIHTDAIKQNLIPMEVTPIQALFMPMKPTC